jgi:hypothetical protein
MDIQGYVNEIRALHASGQTTEHSFRPALATLFATIDPALTIINEPRRMVDVGAVDFVFQRGDVAIGWCEAKDIGKDVRKFAANDYSKAQKERYRKAFPNLIYTNGLDFEFLRDGEVVDFITIADLIPTMPARAENFPLLERRLRDFAQITPLSITSSKRLAEMMAGKAAIIKDIMGRALVADLKAIEQGAQPTDLIGQYEAFKANLIHDITVEDFADIYAETIAYGLFAARLHDETQETFSRGEALDLLPKSNPFLRELFIYIAGPTLDERLRRVIDELCDVFRATNMEQVLRHFGKVTARQDPFLHFYEVFLAEYNPAKRKARGVWYTPEPVVNFIVRAVDEVLKTEFGLADGLADTSRITVDWDTGQNDPKTGKPATIKKEVHRVQILDPATGTGTFLAEVVKLVAERVKGIAPGQWSGYVERDLIPRIHGFELLMASYAMCHMKLDMILTGLGYKPSAKPPRLGVYLTNSLEEGERVEQTLFGLSRAIANEAKAASDIKRQTPIMCVIGNPPYSSSSQNMGPFARSLVEPYKRGLSERKINLDDDYIKFVSLAERFIEKSGLGVAALITNNSYLDGTTLRGMREHLLNTFNSIHVINLYGDARSAELSVDENVFDIMQGVAIVVMVKGGRGAGLHYAELKGRRAEKYAALGEWGMDCTTAIEPRSPYYFFIPKNLDKIEGDQFSIDELFVSLSSGIQTKNDSVTIQYDATGRDHILADFLNLEENQLRERYGSKKVWTVAAARADLIAQDFTKSAILYRPFDVRHTVQTKKSGGFLGRPRFEVMRHFLSLNIGLITNKKFVGEGFSHVGVSEIPICHGTFYLGNRGQDYLSPLYLYPEEGTLDQSIGVNFEPKLYARIRAAAGLNGAPAAPDGTDAFRRATGEGRPDEVKVFDYVYGVLHCPAYRATYTEFLKIDFPRIPFPPSPEVFRTISEQGERLRRLHLMEDAAIGDAPYPFHGEASEGMDCMVDKPRFEGGRVWINGKGSEGQYFDNVPDIAWEFPIGGYQPAQKWLKDRKGRTLSYDDIRHYQKIIKILAETDRIMQEIELPIG